MPGASHISTIGNLQIINKTSKDELIQTIKNIINISFETYKESPIISIIFSNGIRTGEITPKLSSGKVKRNISYNYHTYYNNKLPIAIIPEEYGLVLSEIDNHYTIITESNATILLIHDKENMVNNIKYFKDKKLLFTWTDTIISLIDRKFIRKIGKSILHYENGELSLYSIIKKTKPIKVNKFNNIPHSKLNYKFITMDLETLTINNTLVPYLLCWFDGKIKKSYFLTPLEELKDLIHFTKGQLESYILDMINDAMLDICRKKYKKYRIYLHNFSKFDGYFLIKYLSQLGLCDPNYT